VRLLLQLLARRPLRKVALPTPRPLARPHSARPCRGWRAERSGGVELAAEAPTAPSVALRALLPAGALLRRNTHSAVSVPRSCITPCVCFCVRAPCRPTVSRTRGARPPRERSSFTPARAAAAAAMRTTVSARCAPSTAPARVAAPRRPAAARRCAHVAPPRPLRLRVAASGHPAGASAPAAKGGAGHGHGHGHAGPPMTVRRSHDACNNLARSLGAPCAPPGATHARCPGPPGFHAAWTRAARAFSALFTRNLAGFGLRFHRASSRRCAQWL